MIHCCQQGTDGTFGGGPVRLFEIVLRTGVQAQFRYNGQVAAEFDNPGKGQVKHIKPRRLVGIDGVVDRFDFDAVLVSELFPAQCQSEAGCGIVIEI